MQGCGGLLRLRSTVASTYDGGRGCCEVLLRSCLTTGPCATSSFNVAPHQPTYTTIHISKHASLRIPMVLVPTTELMAVVATTADDLAAAVQTLKEERDTWRAVAESYQKAFEDQTVRLQEVQEICCATQMELENERAANHRSQKSSEASTHSGGNRTIDGANDKLDDCAFGTAAIYETSHAEVTWRPNSCFRRVEHFTTQREYGTALKEIDQLLRGSLIPQARVEGLLLKGIIMRKSEWLLDALAACSEALEFCDRLTELHAYLPTIQYQRGICYYQLRMLKQAREAFNEAFMNEDLLYAEASELRDCCDDQLQGRRPGFEAHRTVTEGLLPRCYDSRSEVSSLVFLMSLCTHHRSQSAAVSASNFDITLPERNDCLCRSDGCILNQGRCPAGRIDTLTMKPHGLQDRTMN